MKPAAIWLVFSVFLCGCGFSERVSPTYNTLAESHFNENNSIDSSISLPVDTTTPTMISSGISTPTSKSTNTSSPTLTTTYIPTKTITPTALPKHVYLSPLNHQWQSLNNCHRASIAILMGYYDVWFTQHEFDIAMDSLADFVSVYGLTSRVYDVHYSDVKPSDAVRWLLAEKIPVIAGQNLSITERIGHYRVIHGYDEVDRSFYVDDPALGNIRLTYETFDKLSRTEGRIIPIYPIEMDELVEAMMHGWKMKLIQY